MATAAGPRWFGVCDLVEGVREQSKMEERISSYRWQKVNLTNPWVSELINVERPVMAAAAWTESKAHRKHLEKAVWLVCLSQQVAKTERRIEELEQELGEVRASAGDSASAAERLREELAEIKQGSLQDSESNRCEKEYLHCQIVEGKTKVRRLQELYARSTEQYRKTEGKIRDIPAAYRVAREEVRGL
ncbi:hypothetical protein scyTo_0026483 [Scyliorhinus torazame]|uniref:Uncharacterized protein n=1 Tax=Scyliorhinus torazame TaxID=75743 RepID=A0A401QK98_SCYTO|nr:hypothetical protein [Scyliorhinus torazame]